MPVLKLTESDLIDPNDGLMMSNYKEGVAECIQNSDIVIFVAHRTTVVLKSPNPEY